MIAASCQSGLMGCALVVALLVVLVGVPMLARIIEVNRKDAS